MRNSSSSRRVVGLTGHRELKDPEAVGALIRQEVEKLGLEMGSAIAGCSSVAIGADTLFAEICQSLRIPWIALLPFPQVEFKNDFSESQWSHALELLANSLHLEVSGTSDDRTAAYLHCGRRTVDRSDVMMAVWDGKPARGEGGTAEVVAYTRKKNKPLMVIDPIRLTVERESFPETDRGSG